HDPGGQRAAVIGGGAVEDGARGQRVGDGESPDVVRGAVVGDRERVVKAGAGVHVGGPGLGDRQVGARVHGRVVLVGVIVGADRIGRAVGAHVGGVLQHGAIGHRGG